MSKQKRLPDRLRSLAGREAHKVSRSDALMLELAAALLEEQERALAAAHAEKAQAVRDDCGSSALVSVARSQLRGVLALLDEHA